MKWKQEEIFWNFLLTVFAILCFPVNPLVLTGGLETGFNHIAYTAGWVTWGFGMALVFAPIVVFPRRGEVEEGKSFVHTTRLVDNGIYSLVRHPQYLGGILAIFVTTLLWYPHWLFGLLGAMGTITIYVSTKQEEEYLREKFGIDYETYMKRIPRMNILVGIIRKVRIKLKGRTPVRK